MIALGKVKWFGEYVPETRITKEYGYITPSEPGLDLKVRASSLVGIDELDEGDLVSFVPSKDPRSGRSIARDVRLFTGANSPELVAACFNSRDRVFWGGVIESYLAKRPLAEAVALASTKLETLHGSDKTWLLSCLSNDILLYSEALRALLPVEKRLELIVKDYAERSQSDKEKYTAEIKTCLEELRQASPLWKEVPTDMLLSPDIWPIVPHDQRVAIFRDKVEEVEATCGFDGAWQKMPRQAKIMLLFRLIKEGKNWEPVEEEDEIVKAVVLLSHATGAADKSLIFQTFHATITNYVEQQVWSSSEPLDFFPLLPSCLSKKDSKVEYCEAKPWPTQTDVEDGSQRASRAFCPRLDRECILFNPGASMRSTYYGARLYPLSDQDWSEWSLLEALEALNITPNLPKLYKTDEYVQKLAGWINRLNEIRQRLKCSLCDRIMQPNYEYSKNRARYSATVFSCEHGSGHNMNIYLNHCWGCEKIIDSRESKIQVEGYYICIHCGSGPRDSSTYRQENICPKCGTADMQAEQTNNFSNHSTKRQRLNYSFEENYENKTRTCQNAKCLHKIRLPAERNRTGRTDI